jgi:hypothetical protein
MRMGWGRHTEALLRQVSCAPGSAPRLRSWAPLQPRARYSTDRNAHRRQLARKVHTRCDGPHRRRAVRAMSIAQASERTAQRLTSRSPDGQRPSRQEGAREAHRCPAAQTARAAAGACSYPSDRCGGLTIPTTDRILVYTTIPVRISDEGTLPRCTGRAAHS